MSAAFTSLLDHFVGLVFIFPAIILHEVSHGYVAYLLGDPTAKRAGRLTLNPIPHVDLWGTLLMPALMLILSGGNFAFGYAKPVPINPWYFKNQRQGMLLTGIAGPATNIALAVVVGLGLRFVTPFLHSTAVVDSVLGYILLFCYLNLMLAFFNLIPIPPLDGSRVIQRFLPDRMRDAYHRFEQYGFLILFGVLYFMPGLLNAYLNVTVMPVLSLIIGGS